MRFARPPTASTVRSGIVNRIVRGFGLGVALTVGAVALAPAATAAPDPHPYTQQALSPGAAAKAAYARNVATENARIRAEKSTLDRQVTEQQKLIEALKPALDRSVAANQRARDALLPALKTAVANQGNATSLANARLERKIAAEKKDLDAKRAALIAKPWTGMAEDVEFDEEAAASKERVAELQKSIARNKAAGKTAVTAQETAHRAAIAASDKGHTGAEKRTTVTSQPGTG